MYLCSNGCTNVCVCQPNSSPPVEQAKKLASDEYQQLAMRTDGTANEEWLAGFMQRLSNPSAARLLNAALGLAGESGEFADHIKKWLFHGHPLEIGRASC